MFHIEHSGQLMIAYLLHHYIPCVLFMTGLLAGTVDAIAGGGGLISLPVLLSVGVPPHLALGTNKLQGMIGTAVATHTYYRQGWIKWKGLCKGLLFSFCGALLGAMMSQFTSSQLLKKEIPLLLLLILLAVIFLPRLGARDEKPKMPANGFYAIFGTLLGFYDGFLGPGVGAFWVFVLVFFLGQNLLRATAYTKVFNLNTNMAALICFALGNNIDYLLALCMALGQLIGGRVGARLAIWQGTKLVRPVFIVVVSATIMALILRNYTSSFAFIPKLQQMNMTLLTIGVIITVALMGFWSRKYVKNKKN